MASLLTIDVDSAALIAALDGVATAIEARLKIEAKLTADNIDREATARVRRRTGQTAAAIVVEETHKGDGYVVMVGNDRHHIGSYLEHGTKFMTAKPFLFASARLEEAAHDRRVRAAVQDVIDAKGLGDG
jgi:hypothetical protein